MKLPNNIRYLEIYYDGRCGMCCTTQEWLRRQERAFEVRFIPYQSAKAEKSFPGINALEPDRQMVVRTDDGTVFRGAEGWVICLLSAKKYAWIARRLSSPMLLPLASKIGDAIAQRRHGLSRLFFRKKNKMVSVELHSMPGKISEDVCDEEPHRNIPD